MRLPRRLRGGGVTAPASGSSSSSRRSTARPMRCSTPRAASSSDPDPATLDLLWSTGEIRSAALLALSLQAAGVRAAAANVHQTGLTAPAGHGGTGIRPCGCTRSLTAHDVVVAPGFLARGGGDGVVSLGRGGSDLTAVLLAAGLGARAVRAREGRAGLFLGRSEPGRDRHAPAIHVVCNRARDGKQRLRARAAAGTAGR